MTQQTETARNVVGIVKSIESTGPSKAGDDLQHYGIKFEVADISQYPMPLFLDAATSPVLGQQYQVTLTRGNKRKEETDGSRDFHFFWDVVPGTWGNPSDAPATAPQQPAQPQQQQQGDGAAVPPPAGPPLGAGWNHGNDIDRREALKEVSFHKQKALTEAVAAMGTVTESSLTIDDYRSSVSILYRGFLALLRSPELEPELEQEEEDSRPF